MTQLYVLAEEYRAAAQRMNELDLDDKTICDTLESISGGLEQKAQSVAMMALNLEATADAIAAAVAKMSVRQSAMSMRARRLREYILQCMERAGVQKIETEYLRIAVRNNPPYVDVFSEGLIPAEYMTTPPRPAPRPDKECIKRAIASGVDVPGCRLESTTRLEIK